MSKLISAAEAAKKLGISTSMLRRYCRNGQIEFQEIGAIRVFPENVKIAHKTHGRPEGAKNIVKTGPVKISEIKTALERVRPTALLAIQKRVESSGIVGLDRQGKDISVFRRSLFEIAQPYTREKTHKACVAVLNAAIAALKRRSEPYYDYAVKAADKIASELSQKDLDQAERAKHKALRDHLKKRRAERELRRNDPIPAAKTTRKATHEEMQARGDEKRASETLEIITTKLSAKEGYIPAEIDLLAEVHGHDVGLVTRPYVDEPHNQNPFVLPRLPAALRNDPRMSFFSQRWNTGLRHGLAMRDHFNKSRRKEKKA